ERCGYQGSRNANAVANLEAMVRRIQRDYQVMVDNRPLRWRGRCDGTGERATHGQKGGEYQPRKGRSHKNQSRSVHFGSSPGATNEITSRQGFHKTQGPRIKLKAHVRWVMKWPFCGQTCARDGDAAVASSLPFYFFLE